MARASHLVLAVLLLASVAVWAADEETNDPDVIVLTEKNFDSIVNGQELMLVEFYAPWCGHCKRLTPEYAKAATILKANDPPVLLGKVDATQNSALAGRFKVNGYPTLFVFRNGKEFEYKGGREVDGIVSYMKKQVGPAAKPISTAADLDEFVAVEETGDNDYVVVGYFEKQSQLKSSFLLVANKLRDDFSFAIVTDPAVIAHAGVSGDSIVAYKAFDEKKLTYTGSSKTQVVQDWVTANSLPIVGEFTEAKAERYRKRGLPIAKFYMRIDRSPANAKHMQYYLSRLTEAAKEYLNKIVVTIADSTSFAKEMEEYGFKGKETGLLIEGGDRKRYVFDQAFKAQNVKRFFKDYLDGKVESYVRSEPIPSTQGPVTTVVGKNFHDVVYQEDKDVLIEFYAPWCGHCKQLAPKWDKLGEKFKGVDSVVIAKIDATANDYPQEDFRVSGFPTIFFRPAGKKSKPIQYEGGEREVDDFVRFIKKHSKTDWSFKGEAKKGKKKRN